MLTKFSGLNPKGPYLSLEKEKENFCVVLTCSMERAREIRKFHVEVVQQRLRNVKKKRDAREKFFFFFCQSKPIVCFLFAVEVQKLPVVVIQKFCYHGNVTSHFSSPL